MSQPINLYIKVICISTGNVNLGIKATEDQKKTALYSDITYTSGTAPNGYTRELIDVDDDPTTTNSSKAYIPVPEGAEVNGQDYIGVRRVMN